MQKEKHETVLGQEVDAERMFHESMHIPEVHARNTAIENLILEAARDSLMMQEIDYDEVAKSTAEIIKFFYVK